MMMTSWHLSVLKRFMSVLHSITFITFTLFFHEAEDSDDPEANEEDPRRIRRKYIQTIPFYFLNRIANNMFLSKDFPL